MNAQYCLYCMNELSEGQNVCPYCNHAVGYEAPVHHIQPGTIMKDRYYVGKALGQGGFGITYIGRDLMLDLRIAIKEYFPNGLSNRNNTHTNVITFSNDSQRRDYEKDMKRYLDEARILAKFTDDAGIVDVRDFFRENGTAYIVMEYLDGMNLREYLDQEGKMDPTDLLQKLDPVMRSLHKIHGANLVHRDISPDNIMLLKDGRLKLLDFGAARNTDGEKSMSVVLKHGYAPEEQYRTRGNQGPWTDVYAMSASIYKCITGLTPPQSLQRIMDDELLLPSSMGVTITPEQEIALVKGLEVQAKNRIQSMEELRLALNPGKSDDGIEHVTLDSKRLRAEQGGNPSGQGSSVGNKQVKDEGRTIYDANPTSSLQQTNRRKQTPVAEGDVIEPSTIYEPLPHGDNEAAVEGKKGKKGLLKVGGIVLLALILALGISLLLSGRKGKNPSSILLNPTPKIKYGYSLENVGSIPDPDRTMRVSYDVMTIETNGSTYYYIPAGVDFADLNKIARGMSYLGNGIYTVLGENGVGAITADGRMLIDCNAARIEFLSNLEYTSDRYLLVRYRNGVTSNEKDAYIKSQECGISGAYEEEGLMYTGYGMIFDLEKESFINLPAITGNEYNTVRPCGDSILLQDGGTTVLYDCEGNELFSTNNSIYYFGEHSFIEEDGGTNRVVTDKGIKSFVTNKYLSSMGKDCDYYYQSAGEEGMIIMDIKGNEILRLDASNVDFVAPNYFLATKDGKKSVYTVDGVQLVPYDQYISAYQIFEDYFFISLGDKFANDYLVADSGGAMAYTDEYDYTDSLVSQSEGLALVINEGSYTVPITDAYPEILGTALIAAKSDTNGMYGVYDLFTGEQLLPHDIERIYEAAGYILAYRDGAWDVYSTSLSVLED